MNNVSYDNEELLSEVRQDMAEFGKDLQVIAIYSIFPENQDKYYITDYIWGKPVHDSDMDIYEEEMKLHEKELATLEYTKHEKMTIVTLYTKLLEQNKIL